MYMQYIGDHSCPSHHPPKVILHVQKSDPGPIQSFSFCWLRKRHRAYSSREGRESDSHNVGTLITSEVIVYSTTDKWKIKDRGRIKT